MNLKMEVIKFSLQHVFGFKFVPISRVNIDKRGIMTLYTTGCPEKIIIVLIVGIGGREVHGVQIYHIEQRHVYLPSHKLVYSSDVDNNLSIDGPV